MNYLAELQTGAYAPQELEELYRTARRANQDREFGAAVEACYQAAPDNVLYAAWHCRLQAAHRDVRSINWRVATPLAVLTGLILSVLALPRFKLAGGPPLVALVWSPIVACAILAFLTVAAGAAWRRVLPPMLGLLTVAVGVTLLTRLTGTGSPPILMIGHVPLLAWAGTGIGILGVRSDTRARFAFLSKSVEVFVTGGVLVIVGGIFAAITFALFDAIGARIPMEAQQCLVAGGGGMIAVFAVAIIYDPFLSPVEQKSEQGLGRLVSTMMRLFLPLTLGVLVVYLAFIPFNFARPFNHRDILIIYNVMLFAVVGLLLGATPVSSENVPERYHRLFRAGILAVAILTIVVGLYALSATVYRTVLGGLTINRATVIGWNAINILLLAGLVVQQFRRGAARWLQSLHAVFSVGGIAYTFWALAVVLALPWLLK